MKNENEEILDSILTLFHENDINIYDSAEIIANLLVKISSIYLDGDSQLNIYDKIIEDVNKNGDTLPNSMARQGLIMLTWLKSKDEITRWT